MSGALFIPRTDDNTWDWENYIRRSFANTTLHLIRLLFDFAKSWRKLTKNLVRMEKIRNTLM
jgi:hypothetical protein